MRFAVRWKLSAQYAVLCERASRKKMFIWPIEPLLI